VLAAEVPGAMALAHDDIWQKFDLFGEPRAGGRPVGLLDGLAGIAETDTVPDISDFLFDVGDSELGLAGLEFSEACSQVTAGRAEAQAVAEGEPERLRHDCMWSGQCPSEEHRGRSAKARACAPSWLNHSAPSSSDLDSSLGTSDLDETLSDCEDMEEVVGPASNPAITDHCYSGPSLLLTPAQSSEDEDSGVATSPGTDAASPEPASPYDEPPVFFKPPAARRGREGRQATIRTRPPRQPADSVKFKFQMKIVGGVGGGRPRSLLRHPARLAQAFYTRRKVPGSRAAALQLVAPNAKAARRLAAEKVEEKGRDIRDLHNSMERQRRIDLKNSFEGLKERIPSIAAEDKVSKLMILNTASDYCRGLMRRESSLTTEREKERRRNTLMKKKLTLLRTQKTSLSKCTRDIL